MKTILLTITTLLLFNCSNNEPNEPPIPCKDENCITDAQLAFFSGHIPSIDTKQKLYEATTLDLTNKSITSLEAGIFNNLTNLTNVDLTDNPICSVDKGDVGLADTVTVNLTPIDARCITDAQLTFFRGHISIDTKQQLYEATTLDLSGNSITSLPSGIFNNLINLTNVDLTDNPICSVDQGDVGLADTVTLTITPIDDARCITNEQLDFFSRHISSLNTKEKLFEATTLNLSNKGIASLPNGIFNNLNSLTNLRLQNNNLTSIPAEIGKLTNITDLNLSFNKLTSIPTEIGNLTSLTTLSLFNNQLASIPTEIGKLTILTTLYLNNNNLTSIPAEIGNLISLTELLLYENDLTSIPAEIGDLTSLTRLDLDDNNLTSIPDGIFNNLTSLTELYLSSNKLTSIPDGIFNNLTSLTSLWLDGNVLTSIPDGIFNNLTSLTSLRLKFNSSTNTFTCSDANYRTWGLTVPITITDFICNN